MYKMIYTRRNLTFPCLLFIFFNLLYKVVQKILEYHNVFFFLIKFCQQWHLAVQISKHPFVLSEPSTSEDVLRHYRLGSHGLNCWMSKLSTICKKKNQTNSSELFLVFSKFIKKILTTKSTVGLFLSVFSPMKL